MGWVGWMWWSLSPCRRSGRGMACQVGAAGARGFVLMASCSAGRLWRLWIGLALGVGWRCAGCVRGQMSCVFESRGWAEGAGMAESARWGGLAVGADRRAACGAMWCARFAVVWARAVCDIFVAISVVLPRMRADEASCWCLFTGHSRSAGSAFSRPKADVRRSMRRAHAVRATGVCIAPKGVRADY